MTRCVVAVLMFMLIAGCSKPSEGELFKRGMEAQKANQVDASIEAYEQLLKEYPQSDKTPEVLYALGTTYQGSKLQYRLALDKYRLLVANYPQFGATSNALFMIGFIYNNELKQIDSARWAYQEFLNRYPNDVLVESAKFELANLGKSATEIFKPMAKTPPEISSTENRPSRKKR